MESWLHKYRLLFWGLSGLCYFLVWLHESLWFLSVVGTTLLVMVLVVSKSGKEVVLGSVYFGTTKVAGGILWFLSIYPLVWMDWPPSIVQAIVVTLSWVIICSVFALGHVVFNYAWWFWFKKKYLVFFSFPIFWILGEVFGSFFFSIFALGPAAELGFDISFAYSGYSIAHLALLYPVVFYAGVYGLSILLAIFAVLVVASLAFARIRLKVIIATGILLLAIGLSYVNFQPVEVPLRQQKVVAVDTKFTSSLFSNDRGYNLKATEVLSAVVWAARSSPDIVLLPEDSRLTGLFGSENEALIWLQNNLESKPLIVDSSTVIDSSQNLVLRAYYYDLVAGKVYKTDKQQLTPQGEYMPWLSEGVLRVLNKQKFSLLKEDFDYRPGEFRGYDDFPARVPHLLFCFESVIPYSVKVLQEETDSSLVLHPVSHAWFHDNELLTREVDAMLRVQAIWNQVTIVSAGNMAESKVYYPNGVITEGRKLMSTEFWDLVEYNL